MIPKKNTLNSEEFSFVVKKGKNFNGRYFFIKVVKNSLGYTRVGVAVSKKLTKKAVKRNYYKRVLRSVVKQSIPNFNLSYDIVIIGGENIRKAKFEDLKNDAKNILNNIGTL